MLLTTYLCLFIYTHNGDGTFQKVDSQLLDNITFKDSHTIWNDNANKLRVPDVLCVASYFNYTQRETLMSNDIINVEYTLVKNSNQDPRSKSLKNCEVREKTNKMHKLDVYYKYFLNLFRASLCPSLPH